MSDETEVGDLASRHSSATCELRDLGQVTSLLLITSMVKAG